MAPPRPAISAVCLERSLVLRLIAQDLASDARDKRGLAFAAPLVGRAKPVPAFQLVGVAAICRDRPRSTFVRSLRNLDASATGQGPGAATTGREERRKRA
jgi:hypothetical protein